jgi:hypothetical protein
MSDDLEVRPREERSASPLARKALGVGVGVVVAVIGWFIGAAVIPRWWAQRVGGLVDGRMTVGSLAGVVTGALCTAVPLLVLWAAVRFRKTWRRALGFVVVAALLAAPNLFLLGIVFGNGNAAHAGERILDVEGPGFRGASLVGAVLGALAFAAVVYLATSRRVNRRRADRLRAELRDRDGG